MNVSKLEQLVRLRMKLTDKKLVILAHKENVVIVRIVITDRSAVVVNPNRMQNNRATKLSRNN